MSFKSLDVPTPWLVMVIISKALLDIETTAISFAQLPPSVEYLKKKKKKSTTVFEVCI